MTIIFDCATSSYFKFKNLMRFVFNKSFDDIIQNQDTNFKKSYIHTFFCYSYLLVCILFIIQSRKIFIWYDNNNNLRIFFKNSGHKDVSFSNTFLVKTNMYGNYKNIVWKTLKSCINYSDQLLYWTTIWLFSFLCI